MTELMKSEFFFFVSTVSIVFVAILFIIVLVYTISILRDVKKISKTAKDGVDMISSDLKSFHGGFKNLLQLILKPFYSMFGSKKKTAKKHK